MINLYVFFLAISYSEICIFYQLFNIKGLNEKWVAIIFAEIINFVLRSVLVVLLSFVLVASVMAPTALLLTNLNIELLDLEDFAEEETTNSEKESNEKELILHTFKNQELLLARLNSELKDFRDHSLGSHPTEIFLPPPENS